MRNTELDKLEKIKLLLEDVHLSNASDKLAVQNALRSAEWTIRNIKSGRD